VIGVSSTRCLLTVHAHPDDEASKGAGTVARYHADGVRTVLVCCTGGEEGEILNPALDRPEVHRDLAAVRRQELDRSTRIIGYDEVVMLGYRDSGMAGSETNDNPDCFAAAPLEEATERLVAIVRRERPQVMVIYGDDQTGYPHPDHLRVHDAGLAAFRAAGDPDQFPGAGPAHQPAKLYYSVFGASRFRAIHDKFEELGLESPFDEEWRARWEKIPDDVPTTMVDITGYTSVRRDALLAHATQVDPTSRFWFGLPPEVMDTIQPHDDYRLAFLGAPDGTVTAYEAAGALGAADALEAADAGQAVETDLFAGVPVPAVP
jgi:mycothiol S-conjugate amidase